MQPQDTNTEAVLEAILLNQQEGSDEINKNLEALIIQNDENKLEPILENMIVQNEENTQKIVDAVKPTKLEIEINGAEMATYTGEKGDTGDKGDTGAKGDTGDNGDKGEVGEIGQKGDKGDTGDKGDKGDKGKDGDKGEKGDKGENGKNGKNGDKGDKGKDGKDVDDKRVKEIEEIAQNAWGRASKTVSLVELDDVILTGLTQTNGKYNLGSGSSGGGHTIQDEGVSLTQRMKLNFVGVGVTATDDVGNDATVVTITGASVNFADNETPAGTKNGVNTTFTLTNTPTSGTLHLYYNGLRQKITDDFTLIGNTITTTSPPASTDSLLADYKY